MDFQALTLRADPVALPQAGLAFIAWDWAPGLAFTQPGLTSTGLLPSLASSFGIHPGPGWGGRELV